MHLASIKVKSATTKMIVARATRIVESVEVTNITSSMRLSYAYPESMYETKEASVAPASSASCLLLNVFWISGLSTEL